MNRGMAQLSQSDYQTLLEILEANLPDLPLTARIRHQQINPGETIINLELSEHEVDSLLDALPPPTPETPVRFRELRQILNEFLRNLRQPQK